MKARVAAYCRKWDMLRGTVLCAVSGGRDSMALLHLLAELAEEEGFQVAAAHFNHQLRAAADRDEAFVRAWCGERGMPLECGRGDVKALAREKGTGVEDAARTLRYGFLEQAAVKLGAERIATAHHRDDNAETVLLHLLRGSGLQGLGGIAPVRGKIVRPLLEVGRAEIDRYVAEEKIPYVEDETNGDRSFTRNRLRLEALPLLEEIAPGCTERIAGAGALLREDENHLRREAEALLGGGGGEEMRLPVPALEKQDAAMRRRLVRQMGQRLGAALSRGQVESVLELGCGGYLDLSGGVCAVRKGNKLILRKKRGELPMAELHMGEQTWGPWRVRVSREGREGPQAVALAERAGPLRIGCWNGGGRLAVENGSRSIKRLFADRGIPVEQRGEHPALYAGGKIAAVFGVAVDWTLRPRAGEAAIIVEIREAGAQRE